MNFNVIEAKKKKKYNPPGETWYLFHLILYEKNELNY